MKLRPTIFLSGVSSEFASFRDAVETEVQKKDCFPLNQSSFGVDYRTIEEILRRNIGEADAVIHIVGFRFGLEPHDRPVDKPRRSYTQMEYDIARELNKPVYVFLSADASVRDPNPGEQPEDAEATQLQLAHRQALEQSNNIRYSFQTKTDLCLRAANIPLLATADFRVDISRIDKYAPAELIGRESELKLLDDAWLKVRLAEPKRPHILTFVALGGEGKTSLVAKWLAQLAYENWPGCDSAFAWSFYSQGTRDHVAASSDLFLKEAIIFFGNEDDKRFAASATGAYEKGQHLSRILGTRRSLLILDGVEPLQYSPSSPTGSELGDAGLIALLKGVAVGNDGLCIVTTRYSIPNLKAYWQTTAREVEVLRLSHGAGVHLLKALGVRGTDREFDILVEDVKGHALTLNLLGTYLRDAHGGDIRRRDLIKLEEADNEEQNGHAFRVIAAYEKALEAEGEKGARAIAALKLLGLFDRPMISNYLGALLEAPAIIGLTEPIIAVSETQHNVTFKRLEDAKLLTVNREPSGALISLDAHPLVREYFALQLMSKQPESWREAHRRLYEHLRSTTPDMDEPSLEDLQPLYQAVAHGCHAGLQQEVFDDVCQARIWRLDEVYTVRKLGIFGSDLGAIACFFEQPWTRVSPAVNKGDHAFLLGSAGYCLRALGRLTEALEPMEAAVEFYSKAGPWANAAIAASNLSHLDLILGKIDKALEDVGRAISFASRTDSAFQVVGRLASYAHTLYQAGRRSEAEARFRDAEQLQQESQKEYPLLYALSGFRFCCLQLAILERLAWQEVFERNAGRSNLSLLELLRSIAERARTTLQWYELNRQHLLLEIALDHLTLGCVALYEEVLTGTGKRPSVEYSENTLEIAVNGLRRAGNMQYLPHGLLIRAWRRSLNGKSTGAESSHADLDEAWEIAERGPMRLHMADIHLYRARLFFREKEYPWESPEADLAAARKLIEQCGYWRRKEELEDAERVILKKSV